MSTLQVPNRKYRWLILPIETKVRELDGKLLLAALAAERGWGVIIGHKDSMAEVSSEIQGIVIEKDGYSSNIRINQYLATGKPVCVLDEEGLVYLNSLDYYRRRLNVENLKKIKYYYLWGGIQHRDVLEHVKGIEDKLILTGNPRFDLLRPELRNYYKPEAEGLKRRYGNFILVNTNFADSNHFLGTEWVLKNHRRTGFIKTSQEEAQETKFIKYQAKIVDAFKEMITKISIRYPNHTIILRPHPSENHNTWNGIAQNHNNLIVIHEGDVNAWLMAADLMIHNSCMTGIQGFLLEKPVISYMPVQSDEYDYFLPNALSIKTTTIDQLFSTIDNNIKDPNSNSLEDRNNMLEISHQYITGMDGNFASERILDTLDNFNIGPDTYKEPIPKTAQKHSRTIKSRTPSGIFNKFLKSFSSRAYEPKLADIEIQYDAYAKQKYPGITLEEMQEKLLRLRLITGRFLNLSIRQHSDSTFVILPE